MYYAIQCTDITTGQTGCFGFDPAEYLAADKPLQFKAITPVFPDQVELFRWAKAEGIDLEFKPVTWSKPA